MQFKMTFLKELLSSKSFLSHKEKKLVSLKNPTYPNKERRPK